MNRGPESSPNKNQQEPPPLIKHPTIPQATIETPTGHRDFMPTQQNAPFPESTEEWWMDQLHNQEGKNMDSEFLNFKQPKRTPTITPLPVNNPFFEYHIKQEKLAQEVIQTLTENQQQKAEIALQEPKPKRRKVQS